MRMLQNYVREFNLLTGLKLSLLLIVLVVIFEGRLFSVVYESFDVRFVWAVLAVQPLVILALIVQSKRHAMLIRKPVVPLLQAFKAVVLSQGLNLLMPARLAELLKGTYLRNHSGVPLSSAFSAVILERTVDLLILSMFGLVGIFFLVAKINSLTISMFVLVCISIVGISLFFSKQINQLIAKLPWPKLADFLLSTYLHLSSTIKTPVFIKALGIGFFGWILSYLNVYLFLQLAGSLPMSYSGAMLVFVSTTFASGVPALPGAIGTYEAACFAALRSLGYGFEEAITLSVIMHITQLVLPLVLALIIMLTEKMGLSSLIVELKEVIKNSK